MWISWLRKWEAVFHRFPLRGTVTFLTNTLSWWPSPANLRPHFSLSSKCCPREIFYYTTKIFNNLIVHISIYINSLCFGLIIGSKHATRLAIARDTNTQITVPEPRGVDGHFQVVGPNRWNVAEARRQIETIADRALKRHSVMTNKLTRADLQELQDILKLMNLSSSAVSNSASVSDWLLCKCVRYRDHRHFLIQVQKVILSPAMLFVLSS